MHSLAVASVAKLIASVSTYPHEVIRTRLREQRYGNKYPGVFSGMAVIAREEGARGLYGGMGPHLMRYGIMLLRATSKPNNIFLGWYQMLQLCFCVMRRLFKCSQNNKSKYQSALKKLEFPNPASADETKGRLLPISTLEHS